MNVRKGVAALIAGTFLGIVPAEGADVLPETAGEQVAAPPSRQATEDDMEALFVRPTESPEEASDPKRSVNMSAEFSFDSGTSRRRNIDRFLGDVENPMAPLPSENTYKGSRSETRSKKEEAKWYE